jgi:hypothetical protein
MMRRGFESDDFVPIVQEFPGGRVFHVVQFFEFPVL